MTSNQYRFISFDFHCFTIGKINSCVVNEIKIVTHKIFFTVFIVFKNNIPTITIEKYTFFFI